MADWTPGMAGQVPLPYPFYIDIVTKRYFDGVDNKNMTQVLNCFAPNAILHEATSDTTHNGRDAIRAMFEDFFGAYETIVHRDFTCTVDEANGRIAASFTAELTDADGAVTLLNNTNFWRVRAGKFQEVYVYMSGANVLV